MSMTAYNPQQAAQVILAAATAAVAADALEKAAKPPAAPGTAMTRSGKQILDASHPAYTGPEGRERIRLGGALGQAQARSHPHFAGWTDADHYDAMLHHQGQATDHETQAYRTHNDARMREHKQLAAAHGGAAVLHRGVLGRDYWKPR